MSKTSTYQVQFRRRRQEKTNYKKRLAKIKSAKLRLVIRKSNKYTRAQIVQYNKEGDKTLVSAMSSELKKFGWKHAPSNIPAAYLTGYLCGTRAKKQNLNEVIVDIGLITPVHNSKIFFTLKGALDANIKAECDEKVFSNEDRIKGKHINENMSQEIETVKKEIENKNGEYK